MRSFVAISASFLTTICLVATPAALAGPISIAIDNISNDTYYYDTDTGTFTAQAGLGTFATGTTDSSSTTWGSGSVTNPKFQADYLHNNGSHDKNLTATFTPNLPSAGWWRVEAAANDPNGD